MAAGYSDRSKLDVLTYRGCRQIAVFLIAFFSLFVGVDSAFGPGGLDLVRSAHANAFATDSRKNFMLRKACEENLPSCNLSIRRAIERERRNQLISGGLAAGMILLIGLVAYRTYQINEKKKRSAQNHMDRVLREARHTPPARDDETASPPDEETPPRRPRGTEWLDG